MSCYIAASYSQGISYHNEFVGLKIFSDQGKLLFKVDQCLWLKNWHNQITIMLLFAAPKLAVKNVNDGDQW